MLIASPLLLNMARKALPVLSPRSVVEMNVPPPASAAPPPLISVPIAVPLLSTNSPESTVPLTTVPLAVPPAEHVLAEGSE